MSRLGKFGAAFVVVAGLVVGLASQLQGAHRALWPGAAGLTRVAPGLWTDDVSRADALLGAFTTGQARIAPVFGPGIAPPRMVVCQTAACADRMGLKPVGQTYGAQLVLIGPEGTSPEIIAHELSHVALHRHMGLRDLWDQRFPAWFDEGLASYLSQDARYIRPADARDADWIKAAQTFGDWGPVARKAGWPAAYGAAARLVEEIDTSIGTEGLRALIAAVADGADFDAELARWLSQ